MNLDHIVEQKQRQPDEFKRAGRLYSPTRGEKVVDLELTSPADIDQGKYGLGNREEEKQNVNFWPTPPPHM